MSLPPRNRDAASTASEAARRRILGQWGGPLFIADWLEAVFLHFSVEAERLQPHVPFGLDLYEGKAWVSLVAFTMRGMRFARCGTLLRPLTAPIATHQFLNLRTYVNHRGEPGIHFITEWLNSRLAALLGPVTFGLPYHGSEISAIRDYENGRFSGEISDGKGRRLRYEASADLESPWLPAEKGSRDEFLLERYTAFTGGSRWRRFFRVWHEPWEQKLLAEVIFPRLSLLDAAPGASQWVPRLHFEGGNVTPGAQNVWMGRPHFLFNQNQ